MAEYLIIDTDKFATKVKLRKPMDLFELRDACRHLNPKGLAPDLLTLSDNTARAYWS